MNQSNEGGVSMKPIAGPFILVESERAAGRLDYQLTELIEFVWACESAAAQADQIDEAIRWGCCESRMTKEKQLMASINSETHTGRVALVTGASRGIGQAGYYQSWMAVGEVAA